MKITSGSGTSLIVTYDHGLKWTLDNPMVLPTLTFNNVVYHLHHIHCHTGSEHTVDEKQYPGECHLVHKSDYGSHAVIGVFLDSGSATPNNVFSELLDKPESEFWNDAVLDIDFKSASMFEGLDLRHY